MSDSRYIPIAPVHASTEAYLKTLRETYEHGIYAIDPYVEVFHVKENVWAMLAPCTHGVADNWLYLVEGPKKAVFIDNGYGVGNLRGLGEMLTGKPCITTPTHFHGDHAYGSAQFDEIYCHKYCKEMMQTMMSRERWDWFNHVGEEQHRPYYLEQDVLSSFVCEPTVLENHGVFDLGDGYEIEMIHTGGHAPGLCCFLDKTGRVLYTGDAVFESRDEAIGLGTGLMSKAKMTRYHFSDEQMACLDPVFYMHKMDELAARIDEFDMCMAGHGTICSPAHIVTDTAEAVHVAVETPDAYDEICPTRFGTEYNVRRGLARVRYSDDLKEDLKRRGSVRYSQTP